MNIGVGISFLKYRYSLLISFFSEIFILRRERRKSKSFSAACQKCPDFSDWYIFEEEVVKAYYAIYNDPRIRGNYYRRNPERGEKRNRNTVSWNNVSNQGSRFTNMIYCGHHCYLLSFYIGISQDVIIQV